MIDHTQISLWKKTKQKTFQNRVEELCLRMQAQGFVPTDEYDLYYQSPKNPTYRIFLGAFWAVHEVIFIHNDFWWYCTKSGNAKSIIIDERKQNVFGFMEDRKHKDIYGASPIGVIELATPEEAKIAKEKLICKLEKHEQQVAEPFTIEKGLKDKAFLENVRKA